VTLESQIKPFQKERSVSLPNGLFQAPDASRLANGGFYLIDGQTLLENFVIDEVTGEYIRRSHYTYEYQIRSGGYTTSHQRFAA